MIQKLMTVFFLGVGGGYLYLANKLAFGTLSDPQAGFMPTLVSSAAVLTALLLLYQQCRRGKAKPPEAANWTKFIFIAIGFIFYITLLDIIGYFAATFIFLFYLFKVADTAGWYVPFFIAAVSSVFFYLLFEKYLGIVLP